MPADRTQIRMTRPLGGLSRDDIYGYLRDPGSEHWQHSTEWKTHLRLLAVDGWVFKTSDWHRSTDLGDVEAKVEAWQRRGRRMKIWHPEKYWFILDLGNDYWACNATPRLETMAEIYESLPQRLGARKVELRARRAWMIFWGLFRFGLILDSKRENFAVEEGRRRLFYIDDELYGFRTWPDFFRRRQRLL